MFSGEPAPGSAGTDRTESVARMSAMVDGEPWLQAAAEAGQATIMSLSVTRGGVLRGVRAPGLLRDQPVPADREGAYQVAASSA